MDKITEGKRITSEMCWLCALCGDEVPCASEDDPLPCGWKVVRMRTGIGFGGVVVCKKCLAKERE